MADYKDQTIVITGGATGIGLALARQFGARGARIVIGEPRQNRLDEAVSALSDLGIETAAMVMDVTDPESVETFADFAYDQFGRVDVLINNAGIGAGMKGMTKLPLETLHAVFDVNVFGVWHGAASFGRRMIARGEPAAIYNLGSENSFFSAVPKNTAYLASKHAVRGMTLGMREEFPDFIRIGLICPGFVQSELTAGPFGEHAMDADEFAKKVLAQMDAGAFYIVTHSYNIEHIKPIHEEIEAAYAHHAPREEGDDKFDVRTLMARLL